MLSIAILLLSGLATQTDPPPKPAPHNSAIVYKCTDANGTIIFSQQPCTTDPKLVKTIDTSAALRTGNGGSQADIAASVADSNCKLRANGITRDADSRIADLEAQKAPIYSDISRAKNNLAGATWETGLRTQLSQLESSIQQERNSAQQAYRNALKQCDDEAKMRNDVASKANAPAPTSAAVSTDR